MESEDLLVTVTYTDNAVSNYRVRSFCVLETGNYRLSDAAGVINYITAANVFIIGIAPYKEEENGS